MDRAVQLGLSAILAWLSIYLVASANVFTVETEFSYMAHIASERFWAAMFLAGANIGLVGLMTRNQAIKLASVLIIATIHGFFAISLTIAAASVWSGTFVIIAGLGYYLSYSLACSALFREQMHARTRE